MTLPIQKIYFEFLQYLCGTISTIGGILFIIARGEAWLITLGRLIAGLGHGIAYIATITHGAENVIKEMRGRLISSIGFLICASVFTLTIITIYSYPFPGGVRTELMVGIMAITFAIMGILFTPCLTYESITHLLYRNNERQAMENMLKLRNESVLTWNISNDLQELKLMVSEDRVKDENITKDGNMRPLLLMLATSLICAFSTNLILNKNLIEVTRDSFSTTWDQSGTNGPNTTSIAAVILVTCRYVAGFVMILFGDSFSRKKFLRFTVGLSAVSLLITNILSPYLLTYSNGANFLPGVFAVAFQTFVGAGIEPMQHVLMSEAFSTAKKYWSIAFVTVVESLIQIAIIGLSFIDYDVFVTVFIYLSIVIVATMTFILHKQLPETRGISLRQARDAFLKAGMPEGITYS